jgi:hypothetical protein
VCVCVRVCVCVCVCIRTYIHAYIQGRDPDLHVIMLRSRRGSVTVCMYIRMIDRQIDR